VLAAGILDMIVLFSKYTVLLPISLICLDIVGEIVFDIETEGQVRETRINVRMRCPTFTRIEVKYVVTCLF
jgi:hypothetical protein